MFQWRVLGSKDRALSNNRRRRRSSIKLFCEFFSILTTDPKHHHICSVECCSSVCAIQLLSELMGYGCCYGKFSCFCQQRGKIRGGKPLIFVRIQVKLPSLTLKSIYPTQGSI